MFFRELENGKYRYYEKFYDDEEGKWKQVSCTLKSKTRVAQGEARRKLEEKIDKKLKRSFQEDQKLKVSDLAEEFSKIRKDELKQSSYRVEQIMLKVFLEEFGVQRVSKVSSHSLQSYLLARAWSPQYRLRQKLMLNMLFDFGLKRGYLSKNPVDRVVLPKVKKELSEVKLKQEKFLSKEEMREYLSFLNSYGDNIRSKILIEFLYLTGLRSGEALALQWGLVDFEKKEIEIKYTLDRGKKIDEFWLTSPKTLAAYRIIKVNDRVLELLQKYRSIEPSNDFVFVRKGRPLSLAALNKYLNKTFRLSGIKKVDGFKMTSHVLRHSHISLLVELNVSIRVIMDRVGHTDEKTTLGIYTHVTKTMEEDLRDKLEKVFEI